MNRKVIVTSDGSSSIEMLEWGETYHSIHGAIQEARHVYIQEGFDRIPHKAFKILEMGFGTGLNAFLTFTEARLKSKNIEYHSIEAFPVTKEEFSVLDFKSLYTESGDKALFEQFHQCTWEELHQLSSEFSLRKLHHTFEKVEVFQDYYDLVYFDVFGYQFQPDLWSVSILKKVYDALKDDGILVTYACRGPIKRAMKEVGFRVEKVAGPPGKREMLVAFK